MLHEHVWRPSNFVERRTVKCGCGDFSFLVCCKPLIHSRFMVACFGGLCLYHAAAILCVPPHDPEACFVQNLKSQFARNVGCRLSDLDHQIEVRQFHLASKFGSM
jgi:hypothetical protein